MTYALNVKRNLAIASLVAAVLVAVLACVVPSAQAYAAVGAYAPVSAQVPAQVIVKGDAPAQAQDFVVKISGADGETVLPDQLQATIAGEGSAQFAMSFTEVGLHHYTVRAGSPAMPRAGRMTSRSTTSTCTACGTGRIVRIPCIRRCS